MTAQYLIARFREPSTWAAISTLMVAFGLRPELINEIQGIGIAVATLAAILLPERNQTKPET